MNESQPVRIRTISELAAATGFGRATVSMALRDDPRIRAETREAVCKAAREGGYKRLPLVSERMSAFRKGVRHEPEEVKLALLGNTARRGIVTDRNWLAMKAEAKRLGATVEVWRVPSRDVNWAAVGKQMLGERVRGVMIGRFVAPQPVVDLPWSQLACVRVGVQNHCPPMHQVLNLGLYAIRHGLRQLAALGYRRPGAVVVAPDSAGLEQRELSYLRAARAGIPGMVAIPPLVCLAADYVPPPTRLRAWLKREKPDVVVTFHNERVLEAVRGLGISVPEDLGYFQFGVMEELPLHRGISGMKSPGSAMHCMALDLLVSMVQANETGLPGIPLTIDSYPDLQPGRTLRAAQLSSTTAP